MKVKIKARVKDAEKIAVTTEYIKLDSLLKFANIAESGGMARALVDEGIVLVNGEICTQRGKKLRPGDRVTVDGNVFEVTAEA